MVCPPTNCSNPIIEEGACCPTCNSPRVDGRGCHFGGDSFFHPAGSRWHPYIPPFGFSRCAICTCKVKQGKHLKKSIFNTYLQESSLTVDCFKEECPRLTSCLASEAIRPDPLSCCKVCPEIPDESDTDIIETESDTYPVITNIDSQKLNDMGVERSGLDILTSGLVFVDHLSTLLGQPCQKLS